MVWKPCEGVRILQQGRCIKVNRVLYLGTALFVCFVLFPGGFLPFLDSPTCFSGRVVSSETYSSSPLQERCSCCT